MCSTRLIFMVACTVPREGREVKGAPVLAPYPFRDFRRGVETGYMLFDEEDAIAVEAMPARRMFTREEYHRMGEAGILTHCDRVELIRGDIVTMSPIGPRHNAFVSTLM